MHRDRSGKCYHDSHEKGLQGQILGALYGTMPGRILLRPLVSPFFSKLGGYLLGTRLSSFAVGPFVKANHIDLTGCEKQSFDSYNDFFTRKLRPDMRPVDLSPDAWVSPCDARLTVYPVTMQGQFSIKHTQYTVESLLKNKKLAERYLGGTLWLYRLCVDDYHRYIYPVDAEKSCNVTIPGIFHTVNPIANDHYPIYKENTREYCLLRTESAGTVLMMEVGAMLVGKIENHPSDRYVKRGQEKGNFAFGGSTIVVMTQSDRVIPEKRFVENTKEGLETKVRLGEKVGRIRS